MKLYLFEAGILQSRKQYFTLGKGVGEPFSVPVPFVLIKHPNGVVLFDTGNSPEVVEHKREYWGEIAEVYDPVMTRDQCCVNAIRKAGVSPEDVRYVAVSHLHLDHAGCIGHFPNARYIVRREELAYAYVPDRFMRSAYVRADFDKPVDWLFLEGSWDDGFDIFGDGALNLVFTPGHTPGHQSLLVNLPVSGPFLFAADACYTIENLEDDALPGFAWNFGEAAKSVQKLKFLRDTRGARVIPGHDPGIWKTLRLAPDSYE